MRTPDLKEIISFQFNTSTVRDVYAEREKTPTLPALKILVLSDVHANEHALRSVLEAAPRTDEIVCLGDLVSYGARPNQCCDLLRKRNALCLAGNHDAAIAGHDSIERMNALAQKSSKWTRRVLTRDNRDWLASLFGHNIAEWLAPGR